METLLSAKLEGKQAFLDLRPITDNPYVRGTKHAASWTKGWLEADHENFQASARIWEQGKRP